MTVLRVLAIDAGERADWRAALEAALPEETFVDPADLAQRGVRETVDVAIVANPPAGALQDLPRLGFVQSLWAGVERLVCDASVPAHVTLARMVDPAMTAAMAETALWAVLSLHRGFFVYARQQRDAVWAPLVQRRADEVDVLVLGLGEMGGAAARRLVQQGYRVTGWSTRAHVLDGGVAATGDLALPALLAKADVVVNLLPLTPATRGFFDAKRLAPLRPGAGIVNLARGAHVDEAALLDALATGRVGHAVLDVFGVEPLPPDHPFWRHPNVTVLPHARPGPIRAARPPSLPRTFARGVADDRSPMRSIERAATDPLSPSRTRESGAGFLPPGSACRTDARARAAARAPHRA